MPDLAIRFDVVAIGMMTGLGYALLGAGLVLIYRAARVINLAHGQIGTFAAFILVLLSHNVGLPYPVALAVALATGAAVGWVVERGVVRPLAEKSRLAVLVATVGVVQVLLVVQLLLPKVVGARFPLAVQWDATLGNLVLHGEHFTLLLFGPIVLAAFALYLERSRYGLAIRAMADNRSAGQLAGMSAERVSMLVWVIGGLLAALAAILSSPLSGGGFAAGAGLALGPQLLLRALAAGLVGRLTSIPLTVVGGIGIGVVEAVLFASYPADLGLVDVLLFVFILVLLLVRGRDATGADDSLSFGEELEPIPADLAAHPKVRRIRTGAAIAASVVALLAPLAYSSSADLFLLARIPIFAIIGISIVMLTGWAGQLSLGQMAFVGFGALGTAALGSRGVPYGAAVGYSTFGGLVLALLIGAPALRLRGLFLTVTTLAFAVAASSYLMQMELFRSGDLGDVAVVTPGRLGPLDFDSFRVDYYACLVALVVVVFIAKRVRSGGIGRQLIAVEGNESSAAAMTVNPSVAKLTAFGLAGAMASFAGGLYAGVSRSFEVEAFSPEESLQVLAMVVVGGIGSIAGAIVGAIYLIGVPHLLGNSTTVQLATSGIGLLLVLRLAPGGIVQLTSVSSRRFFSRLTGIALPGDFGRPATQQEESGIQRARFEVREPSDLAAAVPRVLEVDDLVVELGGRRIIDRVSLHVAADEIVGMIGSNGAGKTTAMNAIGGFVPSTGAVQLLGGDLQGRSPSERARLGLGRSFQRARLYPRLTVRECVQVALESQRRTEVVPSMFAFPPAVRDERWSQSEVGEILALVGLSERAEQRAGQLSTGTRRIVELACLLAMRPKLVLLDEPMAGIAQRESEAMAPLLVDVRRQLGAAMLVIEHDLPLVSAISDRLYCLDQGAVLSVGRPDEVRADPLVIASYLGTDERAIERSGKR